MLDWYKRLTLLPAFEDEEQYLKAVLLRAGLVISSLVAVLIITLLIWIFGIPQTLISWSTPILAVVFCLMSAILFIPLRRGQVRLAATIWVSVLWLLITGYLWLVAVQVNDSAAFVYPLIIFLAGLLLGGRAAILFALLCCVGVVGRVLLFKFTSEGIPLQSWGTAIILSAVFLLTGLLLRLAVDKLSSALRRAWLGERAQAEANRELEAARALLATQMAEQARDLERRTRQLQVSLEFGRIAMSTRDVQTLLTQVVELMAKQLDFYHVGLFLIDAPGEMGARYAVLRASNSEGGKLMLARGHRLALGKRSIVGLVAESGKPYVCPDVQQDATYFANPLLPYTCSEVALPLIVGEQVIGVLDVQSTRTNDFSAQDVGILQLWAGQLALAIQSVELSIRSQEALEAQRRAYGEISRQAWREVIGAQGQIGYLCNAQGILPAPTDWQPEMIRVYQERQPVRSDRSTLVLPVEIRDHVEGVVRLCKEDDAGEWTEDEIALMRALTERLGVALDSARLYQETRLRAAYQQQLGEVTSRIRQTLDIETVLRTAAEQVREALGLPEVIVQLSSNK